MGDSSEILPHVSPRQSLRKSLWGQLCQGAVSLVFCCSLASQAEATTYIYEASRPHQYGGDSPGRIEHLFFSYNDVTALFEMSATFSIRNRAHATEGFWLGLNDGPMPTQAGDLAVLFVHESTSNPGTLDASLYSHDLTAHSYRSELLANREEVASATNFSSVTVTDNQVTFSLSLNTGQLGGNFAGDILSFNNSIGIWFPWFTGLDPVYDQNGRLVQWLGADAIHSQVDIANLNTRSIEDPIEVPEPSSVALLMGALLCGTYQKKRKALQ